MIYQTKQASPTKDLKGQNELKTASRLNNQQDRNRAVKGEDMKSGNETNGNSAAKQGKTTEERFEDLLKQSEQKNAPKEWSLKTSHFEPCNQFGDRSPVDEESRPSESPMKNGRKNKNEKLSEDWVVIKKPKNENLLKEFDSMDVDHINDGHPTKKNENLLNEFETMDVKVLTEERKPASTDKKTGKTKKPEPQKVKNLGEKRKRDKNDEEEEKPMRSKTNNKKRETEPLKKLDIVKKAEKKIRDEKPQPERQALTPSRRSARLRK
jgi:hypothetical protein